MRCRLFVVLLSALCVAGCLGRSPVPRYFALGGDAAPSGDSGLSLLLGSVNLPDYVDRSEMVRRLEGAELDIDTRYRWSGGLEVNVLRALGEGLAQALNTPTVVVNPQPIRVPIDYRIDVDFDELVAVPGQGVVLRARVVVQRPDGSGASSQAVQLREPVDGTGPGALVEAHRRVLERLVREGIAPGIRKGGK